MRKAHTKVRPEYKFNITSKVHKVKVVQRLKSGNKTSGTSIEYHSSSSCSHSSSQPSGIEPGQIGLPENHKLSKAEYTNTQQDLHNKKKEQLDVQVFLAGGFVLQKRLRVQP
jgi:hypothetical protein